MNSYSYRITVEPLTGAKGEPVEASALSFVIQNHDDILAIAERSKGRAGFDDETSTALAISLKMFSEVMLLNRSNPLFENIQGPFREFIQAFKAAGKTPQTGQSE